jgi:hypothetical protein
MCKTAKNRRISDNYTSFRFNSENEASVLVYGLINVDENLGFSGGRILIVDDDPDITLSFSMGVEDGDFEVHTYNDPLNALANFKQAFMICC